MGSGMTSSSKGKRRRADRRVQRPARMVLGDNDRRIITYLSDYRILTQRQLERLLGRSRPTVQRLLRRLYDHRYLNRVFLPVGAHGSSPCLYILDRNSLPLLQEMGMALKGRLISPHQSGMHLRHSLAINEVRIALTQACERRGWQMKVWRTELELKADYDRVHVPGVAQPLPLVPDSYFTILVPEKGSTNFFLELDGGTMATDRFKAKVAAYTTYYTSGMFERRYRAKGFRVLTVVNTRGKGRVQSLLRVTGRLPQIGRRFWFARLRDLTVETILSDPLWQVAGSEGNVPLFEL
jgi:hypothetical protein